MLPGEALKVRKPAWLKVQAPGGQRYSALKKLVRDRGLHTVCEEAACPNVGECWGGGTATLMLMGDLCTRGCRFCNVKSGRPKEGWLDADEPRKTAEAVRLMRLDYVVLTSVDRDDLPDQGAGHLAEAVRRIRTETPETLVEILIPDFRGVAACVETVLAAGPHVLAHNLETVERLTPTVRDPRAGYRQSLEILWRAAARAPSVVTKSSLMLGLGETREEVLQAMRDLREAGARVLTLGQYLRPSDWHLPVVRFVPPEEFEEFKTLGESMGFLYVAAGPLVRSSYRAGEYFLRDVVHQLTHKDSDKSEIQSTKSETMLQTEKFE